MFQNISEYLKISQNISEKLRISQNISKYIRIVLESLENAAEVAGEELPAAILNPLPLNTEKENIELPGIESFPLEKLIDRVDNDRMDILDTLVRTIMNESQMEFVAALQELRDWEFEIRKQLTSVSSPGGMFSPLSLGEDF